MISIKQYIKKIFINTFIFTFPFLLFYGFDTKSNIPQLNNFRLS